MKGGVKYLDAILKQEYNEEFDERRKKRMLVSYYKYGPMKKNYEDKLINAVESMLLRIEKYKETGNTEYLADVANFSMIEYTHPQHSLVHFKATDSDKSPGVVVMGINEIKQFWEENN